MTERLFRFSFTTLMVLALIACSTTPQVDPAIPAAMAARGVDKSTQTKVVQGWALDYSDILNLVERQVPTHIIISYLQSTQKEYNLNDSQLSGLKTAGATPQLINYLMETEGFYGVNTAQRKARMTGAQRRSYLNTPAYQAQQPFSTPLIQEWADPGYEESLYSPFSFD